MKVAIFEEVDCQELEDDINAWIAKNGFTSADIFDIKYSTCYDKQFESMLYSAMLTYNP